MSHHHAAIVQIGGSKGFDPEIYRQQIQAYSLSKVSAPAQAYKGAGDILRHPGASRPESQQIAPASKAASVAGEPALLGPSLSCTAAPSVVPPSEVPPSEVPPSVISSAARRGSITAAADACIEAASVASAMA